jgi:predicted nuclease with TOPRIM domain
VRRRQFISLIGDAAARPLAARARLAHKPGSWLSRAATALTGKDSYAILAQRVQDQEGQLASLHTEIATLTPEVTRLNGENNFYARRVAELEEHNRLLTEAATERAQRVQDQEGQLASLHTEIATLTPEVTRLNGENNFYARRVAELEEHNRLLTEAATERAQRVQDQEGQLTSLHTEIATLTPEVTRLNGENNFYARRVAELEEHNRLLTEAAALDRPLAFMAVPKTSGSALTVGLCEVLPSTARIHGWDHGFFGAFRQFETMSPGLRQQIYETLPPANGIDFVFGQIAYSTLIQGRPTARLMTVLREPRSRILSLWMYWRSFSDEDDAIAGAWGRVRRLTRQPLAEFLNHPEAACQTDNVYVRRLLWPHPLIPDDGFIDSASDERLTSEAAARLKAFDFADVIENPRLEDNVRAFLARPFVYRRVNETPPMPSELRVPLEQELTREALLLVEHCSRLDRELWRALAAERIAGADPTALSDDTFRRTVTRHAALMRPE